MRWLSLSDGTTLTLASSQKRKQVGTEEVGFSAKCFFLQQLSAVSKKIISPSLVQLTFPTFPGGRRPHCDEVPNIHPIYAQYFGFF